MRSWAWANAWRASSVFTSATVRSSASALARSAFADSAGVRVVGQASPNLLHGLVEAAARNQFTGFTRYGGDGSSFRARPEFFARVREKARQFLRLRK